MVNLKGSFQFVEERSSMLLFAQYVEDFCACPQFFDVCQPEGSFTEHYANALFVRGTKGLFVRNTTTALCTH